MKAKKISIFNQCGGAGKTTTVVNLGYHLSQLGSKVLLIDLDPQANLGSFLGIEEKKGQKNIHHVFQEECLLEEAVIKDVYGLDVVVSNESFENARYQLVALESREYRLEEFISPVEEQYDYILIDCPASLCILSTNALVASDEVLIPIPCQKKGLDGADALFKTIHRMRKRLNKRLQLMGILPTLYDQRVGVDRRFCEAIQRELSQYTKVFPVMPDAGWVGESAELGVPVALGKKKHKKTIKLYTDLAKTIHGVLAVK